MANWKFRLDVKDDWRRRRDEEITLQQLASAVAKKLAAIDFLDEDVNFQRDEFVDEFEGLSEDLNAEVNEFDNILERLYDFADEYRLWVATF